MRLSSSLYLSLSLFLMRVGVLLGGAKDRWGRDKAYSTRTWIIDDFPILSPSLGWGNR